MKKSWIEEAAQRYTAWGKKHQEVVDKEKKDPIVHPSDREFQDDSDEIYNC